MSKVLIKKRATYLTMFEDGVKDALKMMVDVNKKSSAYYNRGYKFGLSLNFEEVYVGDEKENQTYYLRTRENENE